jgi:patatin-related protein
MYGGVSLAIYMNGVAQELFSLVRATALTKKPPPEGAWARIPLIPDGDLSETEKVYRDLSRIVGRQGQVENPPKGETAPIVTNFVVDILSGTSAGGLNAIFLAKALAANLSMKPLQGLWLVEGDIHRLINDKRSYKGLGSRVSRQERPKSLLNSGRMYVKLLDALETMDRERLQPRLRGSPYVDELDLYVTATDIHGTALPLQLASGEVVREARHRNVFHFQHNRNRSTCDFYDQDDAQRSRKNQFLAFVARATSAFPFAFEPMTVSEAAAAGQLGRRKPWQELFEGHLLPKRDPRLIERLDDAEFNAEFAFGDGGYLDNKPFSHAINRMEQRTGNNAVNVCRKVLYIEPVPQHPELRAKPEQGPNAIENVRAALLTLPRHETIREDIERVLKRNRVIERVGLILGEMETDLKEKKPPAILEAEEFKKRDLSWSLKKRGLAYGAYHRLKVATITDEMTRFVAAAAGFDDESDEFRAIRYLVRAWRWRHYRPFAKCCQDVRDTWCSTENVFLVDYDFPFQLRRMRFLQDRIDVLSRLDLDKSKAVLQNGDLLLHEEEFKERLANVGYSKDQDYWPEADQLAVFMAELGNVRTRINDWSLQLREKRDELRSHLRENPLHAAVKDVVDGARLDAGRLEELLKETNEEVRDQEVQRLVKNNDHLFRAVADKLSEEIMDECDRCYNDVRDSLDPRKHPDAEEPVLRVRTSLFYHHRYFVYYDQIQYPILYASGVGDEANAADIVRVSPEDATSLIDEGMEDGKPKDRLHRKKLAGTALANFGGFLERNWRMNDLLWGRLDASERLISMMLPDQDSSGIRQKLINRAHQAILEDMYEEESKETIAKALARALVEEDRAKLTEILEAALSEDDEQRTATVPTSVQDEEEKRTISRVLAEPLRKATRVGAGILHKLVSRGQTRSVETVLSQWKWGERIRGFFETEYEVNREFDRPRTMRAMSRASRVIGKILEDISRGHERTSKGTRWVARTTQFFWGFIEVAIPGSFANLFVRHWLKVVFVFEVFLIGIGLLLSNRTIEAFGAIAFTLTVALTLAVLLVEDYLRHGHRFLRFLIFWTALLIAFYTALGVAANIFDYTLPAPTVSVWGQPMPETVTVGELLLLETVSIPGISLRVAGFLPLVLWVVGILGMIAAGLLWRPVPLEGSSNEGRS